MNEPATSLNQARAPNRDEARSVHGSIRDFRTQRNIIRDRALIVADTLLVLLIGLSGWHFYSQRRLGRIVLTNTDTPLIVELTALSSSPMKLFALGMAAGVPVVFFVVLAGWSLFHQGWGMIEPRGAVWESEL
jgi:hypothetical protein